jgi:hypothetical protein
MQNDQRAQRMMMTGNMGGNYPTMMRIGNGVAPNDLKRAAAMNNRNPYVSPFVSSVHFTNRGFGT